MEVGAEFLSLTGPAFRAVPDAVELVHNRLYQFCPVGDDAGFEIPFVFAFGAHSGAGEICAAGVGEVSVDNDGFEVHSRAENSFHTVYQVGIFVEIFSEVWPRLFCVQESYFHFLLYELGEDFEERDHFIVFVNVKVFYVGGCQPEKFFGPRDFSDDYFFVYLGVFYQFEHFLTLFYIRQVMFL